VTVGSRFGFCRPETTMCVPRRTWPVILSGMTSRVGPKGQVVIPKSMRDRLGIGPGDPVQFEMDGQSVRIEPVRAARSLRGRYAGLRLLETLEADRQRERRR
jgi:AbrB family looped-hinge helix DNA binding protein